MGWDPWRATSFGGCVQLLKTQEYSLTYRIGDGPLACDLLPGVRTAIKNRAKESEESSVRAPNASGRTRIEQSGVEQGLERRIRAARNRVNLAKRRCSTRAQVQDQEPNTRKVQFFQAKFARVAPAPGRKSQVVTDYPCKAADGQTRKFQLFQMKSLRG